MKTIALGSQAWKHKGYVALVDDADFENVSQYYWCAHVHKTKYDTFIYAIRNYVDENGKKRMQFMHNFLMGQKGIDHKNANGLDNQRHNLRPANQSQNLCNARKRHGCVSQYKGVAWFKRDQNWRAVVQKDGKRIHIGYFKHEYDAALAYNLVAYELHGEFAQFNTPPKESAA